MPRQARIVFPGKLHHVTQRGNFRKKIFFDDQDRVVYLKYFNETAREYKTKIYAFCLMDNHVHFVVKPLARDSLGKTFRVAHQKYSLYLNKRFNEFGQRWQGRYYSCVVLGMHIPKVFRYVERNPVRARMVDNPWDYSWSSARMHLGKKYGIINLADAHDFIKVRSWKEYLMDEEGADDLKMVRLSTFQGRVYGPIEIIQELQKKSKQKLLPSPRGRPRLK
jgi:putative transposase